MVSELNSGHLAMTNDEQEAGAEQLAAGKESLRLENCR